MDTKKAFRLDEIFISDFDFIGDWKTIAVPSNMPNEYRQITVAALGDFGFRPFTSSFSDR